jgi:hypothetical protein
MGGALLALLAGSALPVWSVWHINPWEGVCYYGSLWAAEASFIHNARTAQLAPRLWALYGGDLVQVLAVVAPGYAGGWWPRRHRQPRP